MFATNALWHVCKRAKAVPVFGPIADSTGWLTVGHLFI